MKKLNKIDTKGNYLNLDLETRAALRELAAKNIRKEVLEITKLSKEELLEQFLNLFETEKEKNMARLWRRDVELFEAYNVLTEFVENDNSEAYDVCFHKVVKALDVVQEKLAKDSSYGSSYGYHMSCGEWNAVPAWNEYVSHIEELNK